MEEKYPIVGFPMFAFLLVVISAPLGLSIYLFYLSFTEFVSRGFNFGLAVCVLTVFVTLFQRYLLISKRFVVFETKGIQFVYFGKFLNRRIEYKDITGYIKEGKKSKGALTGYKFTIVCKSKKQFIIDLDVRLCNYF